MVNQEEYAMEKVGDYYHLNNEDIKILEDFVKLGENCGELLEQANQSLYRPTLFANAGKLKKFSSQNRDIDGEE